MVNKSVYQLIYSVFIVYIFSSNNVFASYNVASYATLSSHPYIGANIKYLVDGIVDDASENTLVMSAPLAPRIGGGVHLSYEFKYPDNIEISGIKIFQCSYRNGRSPAKRYKFEADVLGNGDYSKVIVSENHGEGGKWFEYSFDSPVTLRAIKFISLGWDKAKKGPNYGVPAICEIEIFSKKPVTVKSNNQRFKQGVRLLEVVYESSVKISNKNTTSTLDWREQYPRGIFTTMWKFWSPGKSYDYISNSMILEDISATGANRLWIYPAATADRIKKIDYTIPQTEFNKKYALRRLSGESQWADKKKYRIYPFPSDVLIGSRTNILKKLAGQVHIANLGLIVNQRLLPYGLKGWDFPRVSNPEKYPCILSAPIVAESAKKLIRELMSSGVDGVALGGDEFFHHGHTGLNEGASEYCRVTGKGVKNSCTPTCQTLFKVSTGYKVPLVPGNTEKDMAWQVFEYKQLAKLFSSLADEIKISGENKIVTSLFRPGEVKRTTYGVAYDIMGAGGSISEMSSDPLWANDNFNGHYYIANETKKLTAASQDRKGIVTLQTTPHYDERPFKRPIMVYGSAVSALMHGAKGINYYKDEYIFTKEVNSPKSWVTKVFQLISYLDNKGLKDYKPPSRIAVLYSRASEDWWNLKYPRNPVRGYYPTIYHNAVMEVLFRKGVPYELYYLDQPDSLSGIMDADLIIIPFASSISKKSWQQILLAKNSGVNIIWLGANGETDEMGKPYNKPLVSKNGVQGIQRYDFPLTDYKAFSTELMSVIKSNLSNALPLSCESGNADVECGMLTNGNDYLIFLQNWDDKDVRVNVKSNIGSGVYSCQLLDLESVYQFTIGGESICTTEALADFNIDLKEGDVKIISIKLAVN